MKRLLHVGLIGLALSTSFALLQCGNAESSEGGSETDVEQATQHAASDFDMVQLSNGMWAHRRRVAFMVEMLDKLKRKNPESFEKLGDHVFWYQGRPSPVTHDDFEVWLSYQITFGQSTFVFPTTSHLLRGLIVLDDSGTYFVKNPIQATHIPVGEARVVSPLEDSA